MRVAITGATGLLGHALVRVFGARHAVFPLGRAEADISAAEAVRAALTRIRPEIVVHSAAMRDPDECELDAVKTYRVNVLGTQNVVRAAEELGAEVAFISTDAVFDGRNRTPYLETDPTGPPSVYGRSKVEGERLVRALPNHWVFRISLLFGPGKTNFIDKCISHLTAGKAFVVAADQLSSATYTLDAAHKILEVVETRRVGLYHLSNQGQCSRLELAQGAARLAGLDPGKVVGKTSAELGRPAPRLPYSVMEMRALAQAGFTLPRPWQEALTEYVRSQRAAKPVSRETG